MFVGTSPVQVALTDAVANAVLTIGASPSATSGFTKGGLLIDDVTGILYINTGTTTAATWVRVGTQ